MNTTNETLAAKARNYANANKKEISLKYADKNIYRPEQYPVSVFMAGSPGAGKTESANVLIQKFSNENSVLHIDSDSLRSEFIDYNGNNSSCFQSATAILVDRIHDVALKQKQSFIFDGTFSNLEKCVENIERSLKRNREVFIVYVYQDPLQAWDFVKRRAEKDGRVVPKEAFVEQYFAARLNANEVKRTFKNKVQVDVIVKNIDGSNQLYKENIDSIDNYIKENYTEQTLNKQLL